MLISLSDVLCEHKRDTVDQIKNINQKKQIILIALASCENRNRENKGTQLLMKFGLYFRWKANRNIQNMLMAINFSISILFFPHLINKRAKYDYLSSPYSFKTGLNNQKLQLTAVFVLVYYSSKKETITNLVAHTIQMYYLTCLKASNPKMKLSGETVFFLEAPAGNCSLTFFRF